MEAREVPFAWPPFLRPLLPLLPAPPSVSCFSLLVREIIILWIHPPPLLFFGQFLVAVSAKLRSTLKHHYYSGTVFQCCGSGSGIRWLFDPWTRIRDRFFSGSGFSDPGSQTHIFESLVTNFWVKSSIILENWPKFFSSALIIFNFVMFVATKKGMTTNFFSPLSFVAVFGSVIGKNQNPG